MSIGVAHHQAALQKALMGGINLIDSSANYADGDSESLIGEVLSDMISSGKVSREQIVIVSKAGYLQGRNYELSQERKRQGRPFTDLVEYHEGLEHCIHPEFLADQLDRSLERLQLETLDFYLLHNPEYYLEWARNNGGALEDSTKEYYRRIRNAFQHLEEEVTRGRLRFYGISSNTFPAAADESNFTCLETVWEIAESLGKNNHFRIVQLPLNLMEPGAVLRKNQTGSESVLEFARRKHLGVLVNRPLNAFLNNRLIRLAQVPTSGRQSNEEIVSKIKELTKSEKRLWMKILPAIEVPAGLRDRIRNQMAIGEALKHHWLNFGSYEGWRNAETGNFLPRVHGVMNFMEPYASGNEDVLRWMTAHREILANAFESVASIYFENARRRVEKIRQAVSAADGDWAAEGTLSQKAIRAVRSTAGVSSVLVGMRREAYVSDVLAELKRCVGQNARFQSWQTLTAELAEIER